MTSTSQRRSGRQRSAKQHFSDLPDSSPSQVKSQSASRKRKATAQAVPPARRARRTKKSPEAEAEQNYREIDTEEEEDDDENNDQSVEGQDPEQELADQVISCLDVSAEHVVVSERYANSKGPTRSMTAFAKLSGRDWTYYVHDARIVFGRQPEDVRHSLGPNGEVEDEPNIHIDLGPSKTISRNHAHLYFESKDDSWHLEVYGRNGARINDRLLKKNEDMVVRGGDVITVAGTQMLFQSASGTMEIHQMFLDRIRASDPNSGSRDNEQSEAVNSNSVEGPSEADQRPHTNGQASTAPAQARQARPTTPPPSQKAAPSSNKKRSPPKQGGIMLQSTEQIDYSLDSSRDIKPGCSYASMITWAILSKPDECLSLNGIYDWIKTHYAYYRLTPSGWQNSIRHNLSLNVAFEKVARRSDEPGKGMKWRLVPEKRAESIASAMKNVAKAGGRTASAPGSPAGSGIISGGFPRNSDNAAPTDDERKSPLARHGAPSSSSRSFPSSSAPSQPQFQGSAQSQARVARTATPTQAPAAPSLPAYASNNGNVPVLSDETSPLPRSRPGRVPGGDSSPVLNSYNWNPDIVDYTPAPRPHNLNVPLPATVKLPTSHMIDSSPAPFWKYPAGFSSTPNRAQGAFADGSPERANANNRNKAGGAADAPTWPSSSPPPATPLLNGGDSPSKKSATSSHALSGTGEIRSNPSNSNIRFPPPSVASGGVVVERKEGVGNVGEDVGIDLAKGFTKISSFHQKRNQTNNIGLGLSGARVSPLLPPMKAGGSGGGGGSSGGSSTTTTAAAGGRMSSIIPGPISAPTPNLTPTTATAAALAPALPVGDSSVNRDVKPNIKT